MNICLGICGSIAAYRSPDVVKALVKEGHTVRAILTKGAKHFVTPLVLETFSHHPVMTSQVFKKDELGTHHIVAARFAEVFVIYGATANFLAKLAHGFGDDLLSLQLLAFKGRTLIMPAMNPTMWKNPMVQKNVEILQKAGYEFILPIHGTVACQEVGVGHIAPYELLLEALNPKPFLVSKKILISIGPMRSYIDSARFLQNCSSGKMGLSLVKALKRRQASIEILLGPVDNEIKKELSSFSCHHYETPAEYSQKLNALFPQCDVFISTAAVLDFEFETLENKKLKRQDLDKQDFLPVKLKNVPDFSSEMSLKKSPHQKIIAFAAEVGSEDAIIKRALEKKEAKKANLIIANPISQEFGPHKDHNRVWMMANQLEVIKLGPSPKEILGEEIIEALIKDFQIFS
jgi:phosphopantothenoylcysteine decarboxylase/phosphopantothenate--cysteine ligase